MKVKIILLFILTSCSGSNITNKWDCRNTESKLGCASISSADKAYSDEISNVVLGDIVVKNPGKYHSFDSSDQNENKKLVRVPDKVGRVWIAPYMDANGNYHEGSYIRVVDEVAKWETKKK